jgi:hypothetical protein
MLVATTFSLMAPISLQRFTSPQRTAFPGLPRPGPTGSRWSPTGPRLRHAGPQNPRVIPAGFEPTTVRSRKPRARFSAHRTEADYTRTGADKTEAPGPRFGFPTGQKRTRPDRMTAKDRRLPYRGGRTTPSTTSGKGVPMSVCTPRPRGLTARSDLSASSSRLRNRRSHARYAIAMSLLPWSSPTNPE